MMPGIIDMESAVEQALKFSQAPPKIKKVTVFKSAHASIEFRARGHLALAYLDVEGGQFVSNIEDIQLDAQDKVQLNTLIGEELRRSILGLHSVVPGAGRYRNGILRNRSPEGKSWSPLKASTLRIRRAKAKTGWTDFSTGERRSLSVARGQSFKLRETSDHLFRGLKVVEVSQNKVTLEWVGSVRGTGMSVKRLALMQHSGFKIPRSLGKESTRKAEKQVGFDSLVDSISRRSGVSKGKTELFVEGLTATGVAEGQLRKSDADKLSKAANEVFSSKKFQKLNKPIDVPGRPFIGIQNKFLRNVKKLVELFVMAKINGQKIRGNVITSRARIGR